MMTLKDILQIVRSPGRKPLAYIAVGLLNTVIGYVIGVVCLYLLLDWLPTPVVGLVATMIGLFSNFVLYKRLVFKTKASWRGELIKFVQVYGFATAIGLAVLTVCIDVASLPILIAQGVSMFFLHQSPQSATFSSPVDPDERLCRFVNFSVSAYPIRIIYT